MKRRYESASVLGRWLMLSFWFCIASNAADLVFIVLGLEMDTTLIRSCSNMVFQALNILVLFKLSAVSDRFTLSAIMTIVGLVVTFLSTLIEHQFLTLAVTITSAVVLIVAEYQLFMALIEATEEVHSDLSHKWSNLWTAYFICFGVTIGGALFTAFGSALAALIALVSVVGVLVAAIFKIVFLYRTAAFFRNLSSELQYWNLMS